MPELDHPGREAFAQACARGLDPSDAYVTAGFSPRGGGGPCRVGDRADVKARVAELRVRHDTLRKSTLEETILAMLDLAAAAGDQTTAARKEARAARLEAYRLNELLSRSCEARPRPRPITLSDDEWMAKYGHYARSA